MNNAESESCRRNKTILGAAPAVVLMIAGLCAAADLKSGLTAYYDFEQTGATGLANKAPGATGYHAERVGDGDIDWLGGTDPTGPGFVGSAAFDGGNGLSDRSALIVGNALNLADDRDEFVRIPLGTAQLGQGFSIAAWHYLAPGANNTSERFFVFESADSGNYDLSWGTRTMAAPSGPLSSHDYTAYLASNGSIGVSGLSAGAWHHVVHVFRQSGAYTRLTVFVDGAPVDSIMDLTSKMEFSAINLGDARDGRTDDRSWDGMIDEVAVWNRALRADEVSALQGLGVAGQTVLDHTSSSFGFAGGTGVQGDPFLIETAAQLDAMRTRLDAEYQLAANITLGPWTVGTSWAPVGNATPGTSAGAAPFTGVFDGAGFTISNVKIAYPSGANQGFFGATEGAVIRSVHLENASLTADRYSGALVGTAYRSLVEFVSATGTVSCSGDLVGGLIGYADQSLIQVAETDMTVSGDDRVGGLAGHNSGEIRYSSTAGSVSGISSVGGFVGRHYAPGIITDCFSHAAVNGGSWTGGFAGDAWNGTSYLNRCFSTGAVTGTGSNIGGFLGLRANGALVYQCYWDTQNSGQATSAMGEGKTTAEMQQAATFPTFDFGIAWSVDEGNAYPELMAGNHDATPPAVIDPTTLPGSGTPGDPYLVSNAAELNAMRYALDAHYRLTTDIDLSDSIVWDGGRGWLPLGYSLAGSSSGRQAFTGSLDGAGFAISHLTLNRPSNEVQGLFAYAEGAVLRDLEVAQASINARRYSGILIGYFVDSDAEFIRVSGLVVGTEDRLGGLAGSSNGSCVQVAEADVVVSGKDESGGLVGWNDGEIRYSSTSGSVSGRENAGGFVGQHYSPGIIADCFSHAAVVGDSPVGGFIGAAWNSTSYISRCFSTGPVTGTGSYIGGFLGYRANGALAFHCYWDAESSGQATSAMGENKTTAEMQQAATFPAYDFGIAWAVDEGNAYPVLMAGTHDPTPPPVIDPATLPGSGTAVDPYLISDAAGLNAMHNDLGAHYRLANNIDLTDTILWDGGRGWLPVGYSLVGSSTGRQAFTGSLDGAGFAISNLTLNRPTSDVQGLFGYTENATFHNLQVINAAVSARRYAGSLAGQAVTSHAGYIRASGLVVTNLDDRAGGMIGSAHNGTIVTSYATTRVIGGDETGGLVGWNSGEIRYSRSSGTVTGGENTGGLVGTHYDPGLITDCLSDSPVHGSNYVGGLVGAAWNSNAHLLHSFSTGPVTGTGADLGGLLGRRANSAVVAFCYWDVERSGLATSAMGEGKTTAEMHQAAGFPTFHFGPIWTIEEGVSDPALMDFPVLAPDEPGAVDLADLPGAGTPGDPYQIATAAELNAIRQDLAAHYQLSANIDLAESVMWDAGRGWDPVGFSLAGSSSGRQSFTGSLDGNGYRILHLTINRPVLEVAGLLAHTNGAILRNLVIDGAAVRADRYSGTLVGQAAYSTIESVRIDSEINSIADRIGGTVGYQEGGTITGVASSAVVIGTSETGGLVGYMSGQVSESMTAGSVTGTVSVGGFGGIIYSPGVATDCYSRASVAGDDRVGGFAGDMWNGGERAARCYSTGSVTSSGTWTGGFVAYDANSPQVTDCFWDISTSGMATDPRAVGFVTADMTWPHAAAAYNTWDFSSVWGADINGRHNDGYPHLRRLVTLDLLLQYSAGPGGSVAGDLEQTVAPGASGTQVTPNAQAGAAFLAWSDGSTANPRADLSVTADLNVTARFRSVGGVDIDWYESHGIAPGTGQTWADLDDTDWLGKGMTLADEFLAGTDPNDPNSRFAAEAPVPGSGGTLILGWSSVEGKTYGIEWSSDLSIWDDIETAPGEPLQVPATTGAARTEVAVEPPAGPSLFFRIKVIP